MQGIEGNWIVLGDKSPSMSGAIDGARLVEATLAKLVKGDGDRLGHFENVMKRMPVLEFSKSFTAVRTETLENSIGLAPGTKSLSRFDARMPRPPLPTPTA